MENQEIWLLWKTKGFVKFKGIVMNSVLILKVCRKVHRLNKYKGSLETVSLTNGFYFFLYYFVGCDRFKLIPGKHFSGYYLLPSNTVLERESGSC